MGFFDHEVRDSFDSLFDLNRDGFLDAGEEAMQMEFIMENIEGDGSSDEDDDDDDDFDNDDFDKDDYDSDFDDDDNESDDFF